MVKTTATTVIMAVTVKTVGTGTIIDHLAGLAVGDLVVTDAAKSLVINIPVINNMVW